MCLLVHGRRPTFEIAPIGTWDMDGELPSFVLDRLASVQAMEHVVNVIGPVVKWQLGERPVWTVEVLTTFQRAIVEKGAQDEVLQIFSVISRS